jgi:hypothetical protein
MLLVGFSVTSAQAASLYMRSVAAFTIPTQQSL